MSFSADDIAIAIRLMMDTAEATKKTNQFVSNLFKLEQAMLRINKMARATGAQPTFTQDQINSVHKMNEGLKQTEPAAKGAGKGLWSLTNFARTAIGTLEAMAIFLITKFVGDALRSSIEGIKQLELAIYNLSVAERTLSEAGIDITPQDFKDIIQSVKDLNLAISDTDIAQGVADLSTGLQDLGLSREQLEGLSQAAAIIAMAEGTTMGDVANQFAEGMAKGGKGLADLDIQVNKSILKQKALDAHLVANEEAWASLTAEQRQNIETQALYLIIMDSANTKLEEMGLLQNTVTQTTKNISAEWENLTTILGEVFSPVIVKWGKELVWLLEVFQQAVTGWGLAFADMASWMIALNGVIQGIGNGTIKTTQEAADALIQFQKTANKEVLGKMFPLGVPGIEGLGGASPPDNPTSPPVPPALDSQEDLQKALEKMNNEILEAQIKLAQDMEEAAIDLGRKLEDIAIEYARKRADAEKDYSDEVRDINSSYRDKVSKIRADEAEANAKARNDELEREAKFQNKMQELKEKYFMDLEDALHERDARQVLRLMKQYNLDKTQAERDHALDQAKAQREVAERKQEFARKRQEADAERKAKLAEAAQDYKDKLDKLKAEEEAERSAAQLAYQRKMEDLQREMHNRLSLVAAGLISEFNLTKQGLESIYKLYVGYYGQIAKVYQAMNAMLSGQGGTRVATTVGKTPVGYAGNFAAQRFAEGGSMIADRPTTVTFGEAGLELAQFTPIGKGGRDVNKLFSNLSGDGGGGTGGELGIEVALSPDLEARITHNTLGRISATLDRIRGSKVR